MRHSMVEDAMKRQNLIAPMSLTVDLNTGQGYSQPTVRGRALALVLALTLHVGVAAAQALTFAVSRGPVSLAAYVADEQGYFKREGVHVQMRDCASGRDCVAMLDDGGADVATAAELVVTLSSFTRSDLTIIATISASAHQIKLVARRSAGVDSPQQLRGKRVGTVAGTSAEYFLDSWLLFHDLTSKDVAVVPLAPVQLSGALVRREVDAIAIWEPHASAALKELGDDGVTLPNPRVYTQFFSLVTTRESIAKRETALIALLRALMSAQHFIAEQPRAAREILVARLGIGPSMADAALREQDFRVRLDQALVSTMGSQARWAVREGQVKSGAKPPNPLMLVEPALLNQLNSGAVTLVR